MATVTIRMSDEKHYRLKALAQRKKISINKLFDQLSTQALAEFDSEVHFRALAATGDSKRGLELLDQVDAHFA